MKIDFCSKLKRASGAEHFGVLQSWHASFIREVTGVAILPPLGCARYQNRLGCAMVKMHIVNFACADAVWSCLLFLALTNSRSTDRPVKSDSVKELEVYHFALK